MKRHFLILALFILIPAFINAQITKAKVTNVDFYVKDKKIFVSYDIVNFSKIEKFIININFINDEGREFIPKSVSGDVKKEIEGGKQKQIVWNVMQDSINLYGNIKARVFIEKIKLIPNGMGSALYSLAVPGLGNRFVVNTKLSSIKPVYKTVAVYGLLAYGLYQKTKADDFYTKYNDAIKQVDIDSYYDKSNSARQQFIISTAAGALIWLVDIGWVLYEGSKKSKKTRYIKVNPELLSINDKTALQIGLCLKF